MAGGSIAGAAGFDAVRGSLNWQGTETFYAIAAGVTVEKWLDDGGTRIDGPATVEPGTYTVRWVIRPSGRMVDVFTMSDVTVQGVPVDLSTLSCINNYNQVIGFVPDPSDPDGSVIFSSVLRFFTANDWVACEAQVTLADGDVHSDRITVTAIANGSGIQAQNPPYSFESPVLTVDTPGYDPVTGGSRGSGVATLPATGFSPAGPVLLAGGALLAGLVLLGGAARRRTRTT